MPQIQSMPDLLTGPWSRKMRTPSPSLTNNTLELTIDEVFLPARVSVHCHRLSADAALVSYDEVIKKKNMLLIDIEYFRRKI